MGFDRTIDDDTATCKFKSNNLDLHFYFQFETQGGSGWLTNCLKVSGHISFVFSASLTYIYPNTRPKTTESALAAFNILSLFVRGNDIFTQTIFSCLASFQPRSLKSYIMISPFWWEGSKNTLTGPKFYPRDRRLGNQVLDHFPS